MMKISNLRKEVGGLEEAAKIEEEEIEGPKGSLKQASNLTQDLGSSGKEMVRGFSSRNAAQEAFRATLSPLLGQESASHPIRCSKLRRASMLKACQIKCENDENHVDPVTSRSLY